MLLCVDTSQHPLRSVICVRPPAGANVTGGNLNPAVSFSQLVTCRVRRCLRSSIAPDITTSLLQMSVPKFAAYVIAQIGGAVVAAFLVQAVKPVGLDPLASSSLSCVSCHRSCCWLQRGWRTHGTKRRTDLPAHRRVASLHHRSTQIMAVPSFRTKRTRTRLIDLRSRSHHAAHGPGCLRTVGFCYA